MNRIAALALACMVAGCGHGDAQPSRDLPDGRKLELYSWQPKPGDAWRFALLEYRAKAPTEAEVLSAEVGDIEALRERLSADKQGGSILWFVPTARGATGKFARPDAKMIDEVGFATRHRGFELYIEEYRDR
jgi:hypothetical protein